MPPNVFGIPMSGSTKVISSGYKVKNAKKIPHASEDVVQQELLFLLIAGGSAEWYSYSENQFVSYKDQHILL